MGLWSRVEQGKTGGSLHGQLAAAATASDLLVMVPPSLSCTGATTSTQGYVAGVAAIGVPAAVIGSTATRVASTFPAETRTMSPDAPATVAV